MHKRPIFGAKSAREELLGRGLRKGFLASASGCLCFGMQRSEAYFILINGLPLKASGCRFALQRQRAKYALMHAPKGLALNESLPGPGEQTWHSGRQTR